MGTVQTKQGTNRDFHEFPGFSPLPEHCLSLLAAMWNYQRLLRGAWEPLEHLSTRCNGAEMKNAFSSLCTLSHPEFHSSSNISGQLVPLFFSSLAISQVYRMWHIAHF